jgi:hypothetical protein
MRLLKRLGLLVPGLAMFLIMSSIARADDVTDWNQHMLRAGTVGGTSPIVMTRVAAIVQASVFDAVNGVDRKYAPVHVPPGAAAGASRRAAIVEAAYTALVALYPAQKGTFDARLAVSLTAIASDPHETSAGIASGIAWGQTAANGILSWRATDGFTPAPAPFLGGTSVGEWHQADGQHFELDPDRGSDHLRLVLECQHSDLPLEPCCRLAHRTGRSRRWRRCRPLG